MTDQCANMNHSKMNVSVRYCAACGEIVNRNIDKKKCSETVHGMRKKDRNKFCVDCGKGLFVDRH